VKTLNLLTKATLAILCIVAISACGKKKGSSAAVAATGYTVCPQTQINPYTGGYCQPGTTIYAGGTGVNGQCTLNQYGQYMNQYGQPCTQNTGVGGGYQQNCQSMYGQGYQPQPQYCPRMGGLACLPYNMNPASCY